MRRLPGWEIALDTYVNTCRVRPFSWSEFNCCSFVAGAIESITGCRVDVPIVCNAWQAGRELSARGGIVEAMGALGVPLWPSRSLARRGDVVLWGDALAVCLGHVCVAPGKGGLVCAPLDEMRFAWKVG